MRKISGLALILAIVLPVAANAAPGDDKRVTSKEYVDSGLTKKANKTDVATALAAKADASALADMATMTWVESEGYLKSADMSDYATTAGLSAAIAQEVSDRNTAITTATTGMATQTWVGAQNYLTSANIDGKQDKLTCQNGEIMYFNGDGTYECLSLVTGEYTGE